MLAVDAGDDPAVKRVLVDKVLLAGLRRVAFAGACIVAGALAEAVATAVAVAVSVASAVAKVSTRSDAASRATAWAATGAAEAAIVAKAITEAAAAARVGARLEPLLVRARRMSEWRNVRARLCARACMRRAYSP